MSAECSTTKLNLSKSKCKTLPREPVGMLTVPEDFVISVANQATKTLLQAAIQAAIKNGLASRAYKWPEFSKFEDATVQPEYTTTSLGSTKKNNGRYGWRAFVAHSMCLHKAMFSHSGPNQRIIPYDVDGQIFVTEKPNGDVTGFKVSLLNVENMTMGESSETPIFIELKDTNEINKNGMVIDLGSDYWDDIEPLTDVDLALVTTSPGAAVTTDDFYISVIQACDGTPVSGLVIGDWDMGTMGAADTVVETSSGSGIYRFTRAANFSSGVVNLKAASVLTIDAYESTGGVTVNIP